MMWPMGRKPTSRFGVAPREHAPSKPPKQPRGVARTPRGHPLAQLSVPHMGRPPKSHLVGAPPRPHRPKLVRDPGGSPLQDLFAIFRDLPWPQPLSLNLQWNRDIKAATGRTSRRALRRPVR